MGMIEGTFRQTKKQRQIMAIVLGAADKGQVTSTPEIHHSLPYTATRVAISCSMKFLEKHGVVERVSGPGHVVYYKPTPKAYALFRTGT